MKAHYRTANGRITFEIEGGTQKSIFEGIASLAEVFEADSNCGMCGKTNIRLRVRHVSKGTKSFDYYELACHDCFARLAFGQSTDTVSLFAKRKDEAGEWLPHRGWSKYQPAKDDA